MGALFVSNQRVQIVAGGSFCDGEEGRDVRAYSSNDVVARFGSQPERLTDPTPETPWKRGPRLIDSPDARDNDEDVPRFGRPNGLSHSEWAPKA